MRRRKLGRSALELAPIVLGGNVFGWTADRVQSFAILDAFVDAGFNAIDTADAYSRWVPGHVGGESEAVIGEWLAARGQRDRVLIATKVGAAPSGEGAKSGYLINLSRQYILGAVEGSLRRLRTDYIDLYQSHGDDLGTPLDETLEAYEQLIRSGKVRYIGASNFSPERLANALGLSSSTGAPRYQSLQPLYNLYDRQGFEAALQPLCIEQNVGVICLTALAKGFLTGRYRAPERAAASAWSDRLGRYRNPRGYRILDALDAVAAQAESTPARVALAWILAQPGVTAPIVAVDDTTQLHEVLGGAWLNLNADQIGVLNAASEL